MSASEFPREVITRAYIDESNWQATFYQASALPSAFIESISTDECLSNDLRALSQWRLDSPIPVDPILDSNLLNVFSVVENILTRGSLTLCSLGLEDRMKEVFSLTTDVDAGFFRHAVQTVLCKPTCPSGCPKLDSPSEELAYSWINRFLAEEKLCWTLIPQFHLSSIVNNHGFNEQRVDFFLVSPCAGPLVLEIDGGPHEADEQQDDVRDAALSAAGVDVIRVGTQELRDGTGDKLNKLAETLRKGESESYPETDLSTLIRWCKFTHQIQISLLVALRGGWLKKSQENRVLISLPAELNDSEYAMEFCQRAVDDWFELISRSAQLYSVDVKLKCPKVSLSRDFLVDPDFHITFGGQLNALGAGVNFILSDQFVPFPVAASLGASSPTKVSTNRETARWFLHLLFRKNDFREGQWEAIDRTLQGLDSVVLLPTGAGKSIVFQLSALLLTGRSIVVDPILSLIVDQIDNLRRVGIDRCIGISSRLQQPQMLQALHWLERGQYLFSYVAPERLQIEKFRHSLRSLTTNTPVSLIAIDEAHCVSEWGHSFRTAYLNLGRNCRKFCTTQGASPPPLIALTGTASKIVLKDVQRELEIHSFDAIITPKTFDREELNFQIIECDSDEKEHRVIGFLNGLPARFGLQGNTFFQPLGTNTRAGLIFCPHVNGQFGVHDYQQFLQHNMGIDIGVYLGGGLLNDVTASDFKRNRLSLLVCTKSFGMGIDKPNIRYTAHISIPDSIESFYQEAGRAGRDRGRAVCAIIMSNDDPRRTQRLLSPDTPLETIINEVNNIAYGMQDDVTRALWFHLQSFRGEAEEVNDVEHLIIFKLGDLERRANVNIAYTPTEWNNMKDRAEKGLHRLVMIGLVSDYTINFAGRGFGVRLSGASKEEIIRFTASYASTYEKRLGENIGSLLSEKADLPFPDFIRFVVEQLIHFIYDHVELARRRALDEMVQAVTTARNGEDLRQRIIYYLEQTEWDERLEELRSSGNGGINNLSPFLDLLLTPQDAAALRAATGRSLASYPDVPGLLILRALSEMLCVDCNEVVVRENIAAALNFAIDKYGLPLKEVADAFGLSIVHSKRKNGAATLFVEAALSVRGCNREFVRSILPFCPGDSIGFPAAWLIMNLHKEVLNITE